MALPRLGRDLCEDAVAPLISCSREEGVKGYLAQAEQGGQHEEKGKRESTIGGERERGKCSGRNLSNRS